MQDDHVSISSPVLTRYRKAPRRLEIGKSVSEWSTSTAEDYYRMIYFQVIDMAMGIFKDRFDQRGFLMLQKLETLLISATNGSQHNLWDHWRVWIWLQERWRSTNRQLYSCFDPRPTHKSEVNCGLPKFFDTWTARILLWSSIDSRRACN